MKKYIAILVVSNLFTYAQEGVILPLNYNSNLTILNGTYIKDTNNEFNPFVGTWVGTENGRELRLRIVKIIKLLNSHANGDYYYYDRLVAFYRITDIASGDIIEDNLDELDNTLARIKSIGRPKNNKLNFLHSQDAEHCYKSTGIGLKGNPATNQLLYYSKTEGWFETTSGCNYGSIDEIPDIIPITTPATPITLTRL
jgi:hypothetical protein